MSAELQKAAMILMFLETEMPGLSAKIIPHLEMSHVKEILSEIGNTPIVAGEKMKDIIEEYHTNFVDNETLFGGKVLSSDLLQNSFDERTRDRIVSVDSGGLFDFLEVISNDVLLRYFEDENYQMTALALNFMTQSKMTSLLQVMDSEKIKIVMTKLMKLDIPNLDILWQMHYALEEELLAYSEGKTSSKDSQFIKMTQVFETMPVQDRLEILDFMSKESKQMRQKIEENMIGFEDLVTLSDEDLQSVLYELQDIGVLFCAIQGASEELSHRINDNVSERYKAMLQNESKSQSDLSEEDIEVAQLFVIKLARKLEKSGKIEPLVKLSQSDE